MVKITPFQLVFLFYIIKSCSTAMYQKPRPHQPDSPVVYPRNYCEEMKDQEEFHYVVIGSGPAGATIARRLAENPSDKILLLEAGDDPPPDSDIPQKNTIGLDVPIWNVKPTPNPNACQAYPNNTCPFALAKVLGGNSITNSMMYIRGNSEDYDEWEESGCPGWSYKHMLPYFKKLENYISDRPYEKKYHGTDGPFTTTYFPFDPHTNELRKVLKEAIKESGFPLNNDMNGKEQIGFGDATLSVETTGYRNNIAKSYLLNIPENLKVCKKSTVSRVILSKEKRVVGVEFTYNKKMKVVKVAKEAVICGGPTNTPQILERSGAGRRDVLEKAKVKLIHELKGVGENYQEQYANFGCSFTLDLKNQVATNPLSVPIIGLTGFLNMSDFKNPVPDLQFVFKIIEGAAPTGKPEYVQQIGEEMQKRTYMVFAPWLLRQTKMGYVHITGNDPEETPSVNFRQYATKDELRLQAKGCRLARTIMSRSKLANFNVKPFIFKQCAKYKFNSDDELICGVKAMGFPLYHFAGCTKMGPKSDAQAVVDNRARVHGIKNLRIGDLSVMPKVPRGNTEIPTIAVAERIADLIKEDAKKVKKKQG